MHHSKSLKLWQLPDDFHPELSKGARCLYSRLMTLSDAGAKDCYYSNKQGTEEFGVSESSFALYMKQLKDLCLIETTRSHNKRLVTVVRENAPRPDVVKTSKRPTQDQEAAIPTLMNKVIVRNEVHSWYTGERYKVTAEMVHQIFTERPQIRREVLRGDSCKGLSTDALNLYSHLLDLCDREPCRCLYTDQQGLRELGLTCDYLRLLLKGLAARGFINFFPIEEQFLKGQIVYFVSITATKALLSILRTHADVDATN